MEKHKVRFVVYTRYMGMFGDEEELSYEEEVESEYKTYEEAKKHADRNEEGWCGSWVEVYLDDELYREYEVRG